MRSFKFFILCLGFCLLSFIPKSFSFDDGDFQYWSTVSVSKKLADNWRLSLEEEARWGNNAGNPYYNHADLGVTYSGLASWVDVGLNYRHIHEEKSDDWKVENRLHSTMSLNIKDQRTHELARRLAAATGETLTEAVRRAVQERLQREEARRGGGGRLADRLDEIALHCAALPVRRARSENDILGYDDRELPA